MTGNAMAMRMDQMLARTLEDWSTAPLAAMKGLWRVASTDAHSADEKVSSKAGDWAERSEMRKGGKKEILKVQKWEMMSVAAMASL